jgi:hypothetical protein
MQSSARPSPSEGCAGDVRRDGHASGPGLLAPQVLRPSESAVADSTYVGGRMRAVGYILAFPCVVERYDGGEGSAALVPTARRGETRAHGRGGTRTGGVPARPFIIGFIMHFESFAFRSPSADWRRRPCPPSESAVSDSPGRRCRAVLHHTAGQWCSSVSDRSAGQRRHSAAPPVS